MCLCCYVMAHSKVMMVEYYSSLQGQDVVRITYSEIVNNVGIVLICDQVSLF